MRIIAYYNEEMKSFSGTDEDTLIQRVREWIFNHPEDNDDTCGVASTEGTTRSQQDINELVCER